MEVAGRSPPPPPASSSSGSGRWVASEEQVKVRRRTLQVVLKQCQMALELLQEADREADLGAEEEEGEEGPGACAADREADEICDLLKSKVESPDFLEKLGSIHMSISKTSSDDTASWDIVSTTDLWEDKCIDGKDETDQDDYVLVSQEDIVEGVACFMAAYLLSLEQTKWESFDPSFVILKGLYHTYNKAFGAQCIPLRHVLFCLTHGWDLTPNQLQEALSKTFSLKKKKSKLQKAWDGSRVIYNVASWSATAIGIYQNPAIIRAATVAFWSSCRVISRLF